MIDESGPRAAGQSQPPDPGAFDARSDRDGDVLTITLVGELDIGTAGAAQRALDEAEATDAGVIVVDLSGLTFMDSTGIRLLLSAHARSRANGNRLTLRRGPASVQRVLELCAVDELLPFADPSSPGA
jgi:anti-anti-sigma factor